MWYAKTREDAWAVMSAQFTYLINYVCVCVCDISKNVNIMNTTSQPQQKGMDIAGEALVMNVRSYWAI